MICCDQRACTDVFLRLPCECYFAEQVWAQCESEWNALGDRSRARVALLQMPPEEFLSQTGPTVESSKTSTTPAESHGEAVSLIYELFTRPEAARKAEFLRFRLRFIADQECEVSRLQTRSGFEQSNLLCFLFVCDIIS